MLRSSNGWTSLAVVLATALALSACGGGGGGGGGGSTASLSFPVGAFPSVTTMTGTTSTTTPLNYTTPSNSMPEMSIDIASTMAGDITVITIPFTMNLLASSIISGVGAGADGVALRSSDGTAIPLFLDATGAIDPSNTFPATNVAPALLRLYVQTPGMPGVPGRLMDGQYTLTIVPTQPVGGVQGANGEPFCLLNSNGCSNPVIPTFPFNVGDDMTLLDAASVPSDPLANAIGIATNKDIRLFFDDAVDFASVVGGAANLSSVDPFISVPFPIAAANPMANVVVNYTPPSAMSALPPNYGFVVYQPDPFHNPTEVRIRFVDLNFVSGNDTPPSVQNYATDPAVWQSAGLAPRVNRLGQTLSLPAPLALPGSDANPAMVNVALLGGANMAAVDSSVAGDGMAGVTDRDRNPLMTTINANGDLALTYGLAMGQQIANNPSPADATYIEAGGRLGVVSSGRVTSNAGLFGTLTGSSLPVPNPLQDSSVLGSVRDVVVGRFISIANGQFVGAPAVNYIGNAPRPANVANTIALGLDPAIPMPVGGVAPVGLDALGIVMGMPPVQPLGVFLYVADATLGRVSVFNSTTFQLLGTLTGVPNPGGLGLDPGQNNLYISSFDSGTLLRVGTNPGNPATFHQVTGTTAVGSLPTAVAVQPANEDVLVINSGDNSFSRVTVGNFMERAVFATGQGPREIVATPRWFGMGTTQAYQAYVTNFLSDSVSIYESDSFDPSVNQTNGPDGKIWQVEGGFNRPTYGVWNRFLGISGQGIGGQGMYVANSQGNSVTHMGMTNFNIGPMPGFMGIPAFRTFMTVQAFTAPASLGSPGDVAIEPLTGLAVLLNPPGNPRAVVVSFPSAGQVGFFDLSTSALLGTVQAPGTQLYNWMDQ